MTNPRLLRRPLLLVFGALLALLALQSARADGEAGLVLQDGDTVRTYCIPFTGDGITGQQMIAAAGLTASAYGSGALAVCSIGQRGCLDSSSFASCFCQCQGGDCTYWAFFTRQYGKGWVYSSLGFNLLRAKDGDVHGWKWGAGGPNSAPAPQDITFEQVCGHAPRGGAAPTESPPTQAPATQRPPSTATTAAPATSAATTAATAPATTAVPSPSAVSTITVTITRDAGGAPTATAVPAFELPPDSGGDDDKGDSNLGLVAFGLVAAGMVAAIAGAGLWRARRGR